MSSHRSVSLRVHLGRHGATYALTHRAERDGRTRDGRLSWGVLRYASRQGLPQDVLAVLARALLDLQDKHGVCFVVPAPGAREPLGAVGGGSVRGAGGYSDDPHAGQGLDVPLPGL